jgi:DNA-binding transcriptional LysR family regulator
LIAAYYLPTTMGAFRSLHADVNMSLDIGENAWAIERVRSGTCDLGIVVNPGSEHFERFPVYADTLVVILPPSHRAAADPSGEIDFESEALILREHGSRTRALAEEALKARNRSPKQIIELADAEAIKRAVRAGIGISIITEQAVRDEVAIGNLVARPFLDGSTSMSIEIIHRKGRELAPAMKGFLAAFKAQVARMA